MHVKITFSSAVNKTQAFLPSDPASQVYILRTRNIWVKREGEDLQCSNPTKCLLKDKMRESRRNSQSLLQKELPYGMMEKFGTKVSLGLEVLLASRIIWTNSLSVGSKLSTCQIQDFSSPVLKTNQREIKSVGDLRCKGTYMWLQLRGVISIYFLIPGCSLVSVPQILA